MIGNNGLQDYYLNSLKEENMPLTIFLINGFQMRGEIKALDNFTVVVNSSGSQQMIYKHAISTIIPDRPLDLSLI